MTITVHHDGYPDRLARESCMCEVTAMARPDWPAYVHNEHVDGGIGWYLRPLDVDEPPVYLVEDCTCRCHESARQFLHNIYDPT